MTLPRTLLEAIRFFADPTNCLHFMIEKRWPTGEISCPTCGGGHLRFDRKRLVWTCNAKHPRRQFSVKVGTIFEDSPLGLEKWLPCVWMIANMKNGVSSHEIARSLGVTQKTAWFMLHRIRLAMKETAPAGMSGVVEADETYVGGKVTNMGLLERHGNDGNSVVRTQVIEGTKRRELLDVIRKHVALGSELMTDALPSYASLNHLYMHQFIDHSEAYVLGAVHTNGLENFWALLKRSIHGTYVAIEPAHLEAYVDEQAFRFNYRKVSDTTRFQQVSARLLGRRLTYADLTGDAKKANN